MLALKLVKQLEHTIRANSPALLTALGASGVITTAYLSGKATYEAATKLNAMSDLEYLSRKEKVEMVWQLYIPAAVSGVVTIGCIFGANHISSKRAATAYSLLALSESAFVEYRDKVVEQIGEKKEQSVRDSLAQDKVSNNPPSTGVIVAGAGDILCCELFTGRYFNSDMETLRRAENDINAKLVREMWVPLSELYYILGLPYTSQCGNVGWESDKHLVLQFSTVMSEDNRPCIAFEYNYVKPLR